LIFPESSLELFEARCEGDTGVSRFGFWLTIAARRDHHVLTPLESMRKARCSRLPKSDTPTAPRPSSYHNNFSIFSASSLASWARRLEARLHHLVCRHGDAQMQSIDHQLFEARWRIFPQHRNNDLVSCRARSAQCSHGGSRVRVPRPRLSRDACGRRQLASETASTTGRRLSSGGPSDLRSV
jgi:hypothetical protein